jgi:phage gpG-like protein
MHALDAFARVLLTRIKLGFKTGTAPDGSKWKKTWRNGQPLRNTGRMAGSFTSRRDGDAIVVGSNLRIPGRATSLPAVHQYGMTIKPVNGKYLVFARPSGKGLVFAKQVVIPARPMMPLDSAGNVAIPAPWMQSALVAMAKALEVNA